LPSRSKKINAKLIPPIKAADTSSGQEETNKFQIQKDSSASQTIRNKIKAKAKILADLQANKPVNLLSNEETKQEMKRWPVLQAIRTEQTKPKQLDDEVQAPKQETISHQSNGTVPNVPHVSPED
jgi:hypothetical protein